jgi:predicted cupin superfamily sugar epimerase
MLAYCDYIAALIQEKMTWDIDSHDTVIKDVSHVQMDLHPEEGYFMTTKKTIIVEDKGGKMYRVTVEEV